MMERVDGKGSSSLLYVLYSSTVVQLRRERETLDARTGTLRRISLPSAKKAGSLDGHSRMKFSM
jgi:hypothetical protein